MQNSNQSLNAMLMHIMRLKRPAELFIQILIFTSLITFALETLPNLNASQKHSLWFIELFTVIVFTIEIGLRIYFIRPRRKYLFSIGFLVDLVSVLPFYFHPSIDLCTIRIFRLFRLIRILKLTRYSRTMNRFSKAFIAAKEEMILFSITACMLLYVSSVLMYYCEHEAQPNKFTSVFDSLWWAVATLTTVGYGDIYPITPLGKILTFIILLIGLGVIAVPTGLVSAALTTTKNQTDNE